MVDCKAVAVGPDAALAQVGDGDYPDDLSDDTKVGRCCGIHPRLIVLSFAPDAKL
jgi:hypothetical protein